MNGLPETNDADGATAIHKQPKRRFVGRRTAEAQAKLREDEVQSVEETNAVVQRGGCNTHFSLDPI